MRKNQSGFSVIEVLIVVVVIGLLGGAGWYIWQSNNKNNKNDTSQMTAADQARQNNSSSKEEEKPTKTSLPFTYAPPEGWESSIYNKGDIYSVALRAPGTITDDEVYTTVIQGAVIYISCPKTAVTNLEQFKKEDSLYTQSSRAKQDLTINQTQAVQYVGGNEGPEKRITHFFVGSTMCGVTIEENAYSKTEFSKAYDQLLDSVKF